MAAERNKSAITLKTHVKTDAYANVVLQHKLEGAIVVPGALMTSLALEQFSSEADGQVSLDISFDKLCKLETADLIRNVSVQNKVGKREFGVTYDGHKYANGQWSVGQALLPKAVNLNKLKDES